MLTDIRSRDVELAECDIEVLDESESHEVLGEGVFVDDSHELVDGFYDLLAFEVHMGGTPRDQVEDFAHGALGQGGIFKF